MLSGSVYHESLITTPGIESEAINEPLITGSCSLLFLIIDVQLQVTAFGSFL